ncbi:MAG TPA: TlpA family protein disulfide reductase [Aeromonadales bacterium]|nr:TlpA family protein disulfide reductase [Aeromonadales bacterium]
MKKLLVSACILLFSFTANAASPIDLSPYKGKVVYLDFWASWCVPCRESFPWMNQLRRDFKTKDLAIIAVNVDKNPELVAQFLKKYPASFKIMYDAKGEHASYYKLQGMPSSFIFDREGKLVKSHKGFFTKNKQRYEQEIREVVMRGAQNEK